MLPPSSFENGLCGFQYGCGSHNRHHVCQLGKPLSITKMASYPCDSGKLVISPWTYYAIATLCHGNTIPWRRQDRQWLQVANLLWVRGSIHLALYTSLHKVGYVLLYARPRVPPWTILRWLFSPLWSAMELWLFSLKTNSLNLPCGTYTRLCLYLSNPSTKLTSLSALLLRSSPRSLCTLG